MTPQEHQQVIKGQILSCYGSVQVIKKSEEKSSLQKDKNKSEEVKNPYENEK